MNEDPQPSLEPKQTQRLNYESVSPVVGESGWIQVKRKGRAVDVLLPPICCECLIETMSRWRVPSVTVAEITIPICNQCRRRWHIWRIALVLISVVVTLCAAVANCLAEGTFSASSLITIACFYFALGLTVCFVLMHFFGAPVRLAIIGRYSSTARIRFRNRSFSALLLQKNAMPSKGFGSDASLHNRRKIGMKPGRR